MKNLYESILDDEDVIIKNTGSDLKCPLLSLYHLYKQHKSFEKVSDKDIREIIISAGLPRAKYLVIKKQAEFISLYDETMTNITQKPICRIFVGRLSWILCGEADSMHVDLNDKKSIINKFFGGKKKYDDFCKKMWDWGFAQPFFWRFYYKSE